MDQFLRDPIWQFVGVAISLVALVVAVVAIRTQQQRKVLAYYFSSERPALYLVNSAFEQRLVLTLDGKPVQGLSTYDVAVFNDGNVPVVPGDFIEPLCVQFSESSKVLAVAVTDTNPTNLNVSVDTSARISKVAPVLLNPGDEFVLQFLVDQTDDSHYQSPTIAGRVAGVSKLEQRTSRPARLYRMRFYRFVLLRNAPVFVLGVLVAWGSSVAYSLLSRLPWLR